MRQSDPELRADVRQLSESITLVFAAALAGSLGLAVSGAAALGADSTDSADSADIPFTVIRPAWFGASPDDGADDYPGFLATVKLANAIGHDVIVELRPGEYQIDQYRRKDDPSSPEQLWWGGIDGLTIEGNGATIQSFGAFNRRAGTGKYPSKSPDNSIGLLNFRDVRNLNVSDLTVLGGVERMTRDPGVAENGGNNGITLAGVEGAVLSDVEASYWAADGVYLAASRLARGRDRATKDVQLRRLKAYHNRRQGLSIIQANGVLCEDCDLSHTGSSLPYGAHNPRAGVDIEPHDRACDDPNRDPSAPCVDVITGGITFIRPRLYRNGGFCFVAEDTNKIDDVTLVDTTCEVSPSGRGGSGMLLSVRRGVVDGGTFDLKRRRWYLSFKQAFKSFPSSLVVRNASITSDGAMGLYYGGSGGGLPKTVRLENVDYSVGWTGQRWASTVLFFSAGPLSWSGGRVSLAAGGHDGRTFDYAVKLRQTGLVEGVTFSTDLDGKATGLRYSISADKAKLCNVQMDSPTTGIGLGTKITPSGTVYRDGCED